MEIFTAVLRDECGDEFVTQVTAENKAAAYEQVREDYPECSPLDMTSEQGIRDREARRFALLSEEIYND